MGQIAHSTASYDYERVPIEDIEMSQKAVNSQTSKHLQARIDIIKHNNYTDECGSEGYASLSVVCCCLIIFFGIQFLISSQWKSLSKDQLQMQKMIDIISMGNSTKAIRLSLHKQEFNYRLLAKIINTAPKPTVELIESFILEQTDFIINTQRQYDCNHQIIALNDHLQYENLLNSTIGIDQFDSRKAGTAAKQGQSRVKLEKKDGIDFSVNNNDSLFIILSGKTNTEILAHDIFRRSIAPIIDKNILNKFEGIYMQNLNIFRQKKRNGYRFKKRPQTIQKILLASLFHNIDCDKVALNVRLTNILGYALSIGRGDVIIEFMDDIFNNCADEMTPKQIAQIIKKNVARTGRSVTLNLQSVVYKLFK